LALFEKPLKTVKLQLKNRPESKNKINLFVFALADSGKIEKGGSDESKKVPEEGDKEIVKEMNLKPERSI